MQVNKLSKDIMEQNVNLDFNGGINPEGVINFYGVAHENIGEKEVYLKVAPRSVEDDYEEESFTMITYQIHIPKDAKVNNLFKEKSIKERIEEVFVKRNPSEWSKVFDEYNTIKIECCLDQADDILGLVSMYEQKEDIEKNVAYVMKQAGVFEYTIIIDIYANQN